MGRKYYYYSVILISSTTYIMFPVMISEIELQMDTNGFYGMLEGLEKLSLIMLVVFIIKLWGLVCL